MLLNHSISTSGIVIKLTSMVVIGQDSFGILSQESQLLLQYLFHHLQRPSITVLQCGGRLGIGGLGAWDFWGFDRTTPTNLHSRHRLVHAGTVRIYLPDVHPPGLLAFTRRVSLNNVRYSCPIPSLEIQDLISSSTFYYGRPTTSNTMPVTTMKALNYVGPYEVQVQDVEKPRLEHPDDIIVKITSVSYHIALIQNIESLIEIKAAICGSDLQ